MEKTAGAVLKSVVFAWWRSDVQLMMHKVRYLASILPSQHLRLLAKEGGVARPPAV